jgi:hypothetical protein
LDNDRHRLHLRGEDGSGPLRSRCKAKARRATTPVSSGDGDNGLPEWALPESVTVAMADLAETAKEGLLALAVGTCLQVMQVIMEEDVCALAGPKGRWQP